MRGWGLSIAEGAKTAGCRVELFICLGGPPTECCLTARHPCTCVCEYACVRTHVRPAEGWMVSKGLVAAKAIAGIAVAYVDGLPLTTNTQVGHKIQPHGESTA